MAHRLYNLKKLNEIAQGDETFIRDMAVEFVLNVTASLESIQALKPAEKWTTIAEIAHKLASNYAYLGADKLKALAADIERSVLNDNNLTGISEKTEEMCNDSILLISQIKKDFDINN